MTTKDRDDLFGGQPWSPALTQQSPELVLRFGAIQSHQEQDKARWPPARWRQLLRECPLAIGILLVQGTMRKSHARLSR